MIDIVQQIRSMAIIQGHAVTQGKADTDGDLYFTCAHCDEAMWIRPQLSDKHFLYMAVVPCGESDTYPSENLELALCDLVYQWLTVVAESL